MRRANTYAKRRWGTRVVIAAAIAPILAWTAQARGGGNFDADQLSLTNTWKWDVTPNVPAGLNWDLDTLPAAAQPIVFDHCGDGTVDMNAANHSHPALTFKDWLTYDLTNGTFQLNNAASTINVGGSVSSTDGNEYFADGNTISGTLNLGAAGQTNTINFTNAGSGALRLSGSLVGAGSLTIQNATGVGELRAVYFDQPNAGYNANVILNKGTEARFLCTAASAGRAGIGGLQFTQGGGVAILSENAQAVAVPVLSQTGWIRADHNYTANANPAYAPGVLHTFASPILVDDPTVIGNPAAMRFSADNGYNFRITSNLAIINAAAPMMPVQRVVNVSNGDPRWGIDGSLLMTGPNRLQELVVTTTAATFTDITGGGIGQNLEKRGTGVLEIQGNNVATSAGAKNVYAGVLRFSNANAYGKTIPGGALPTVTLQLGALVPTVDSGFGISYNIGLPRPNLATQGAIPGQSGAMDVDLAGQNAGINLNKLNTAGAMTGMRLGSSGTGLTTSVIVPYGGAGFDMYYLGGGGGTLTIGSVLGPGASGFGMTGAEMGTTGQLLPGRVALTAPVNFGGPMNIRAGTLQVTAMPMTLPATGLTSLGAYSTALSSGCAYSNAGLLQPYNGPGQLLLDAATENGGGYNYFGGGNFGALGLKLDGGAIGWNGNVNNVFGGAPPVPMMGGTLISTLYASVNAAVIPMNTQILHFGGEYSSGTWKVTFPTFDYTGQPVALVKSGINSTLDLTGMMMPAANTGGTGIMGGEIKINDSIQLGNGAIVICDGGTLHVAAGGPPAGVFFNNQILRVANGPGGGGGMGGSGGRASTIDVDAGVTAGFNLTAFEADATGSVLRKAGLGTLQLEPPFPYTPAAPGNTWGVRASKGLLEINQLPGVGIAANGSAVFDGGNLHLVSPVFAIPAGTQYNPNYGFGGIQTYASTVNSLILDNGTFFRVDGGRVSSLMGALGVTMGNNSVFQMAEDPAGGGGDNRGTGTLSFSGSGFVQFNPTGLGKVLFPRDGGFSMYLDNGAQFSGCPEANFNGNLYFNSSATSTVIIDAATVSSAPAAAASAWTITGTGWTNWNGMVVKGMTEAVPGSGGPFVTGTVVMNRCGGAPVTVNAGAKLIVNAGAFQAGGMGDPFTDSTTTLHLPIVNNSSFDITAGTKHVASIIGTGTTTVAAGATLLVGSTGPVQQSAFVVNGGADVGDVDVTGTTSVTAAPTAKLSASYVRGNTLSIGTGKATIKDNGSATGTSNVANLNIVGGQLDLRDNKLIVNTTPIGTWFAGAYTGVTGMIQTGRAGGAWTGSGIITSMTSAASPSVLTGLAVASAANARGITGAQTALFGGQTVSASDTLVMYTYGGDANLSGRVDADDYFRIDSNYNKSGTVFGWYNGDFDYNGAINGDDYFIIDSAYVGQTTPFSTAAPLTGVTAAPEPASLTLLALIAASRCVRRRRN